MADTHDGGLERQDLGPVTVLRIKMAMMLGDQASDELFAKLDDAIDNSAQRKFVLDVGAIQYFASAALGKLVSLNRKARAADARLVMCNVTPSVARVLELTRLADVLISYDSEGEAVRSLS